MTIQRIALLFTLFTIHCTFNCAQENRNPYSKALGNTLYNSGYTEQASSLHLEENCQIRFHYNNLYLTKELNQCILDGKINIHRSAIGLQYSFFGYHLYKQQSISLSSALTLVHKLTVGCSIHYRNYHYTGMTGRQYNLSAAIDMLVQCEKVHIYGKYHQQMICHQRIEEIRNKLFLGFIQKPVDSILWLIECESTNWQQWHIKCAFQYHINDFCLRLGVWGLPIIPCFGIGYHYKKFTFDIADQWNMHIGHTLSFGINYQLHIKK